MRCGIHGWRAGELGRGARGTVAEETAEQEGFCGAPISWVERSPRALPRPTESGGGWVRFLGGFLESDDGCSSAEMTEHFDQTGEQAAEQIYEPVEMFSNQ